MVIAVLKDHTSCQMFLPLPANSLKVRPHNVGCRGGQRSVPAAGRLSNCITYDCIIPVTQKAGCRGGPV